MKHIVIGCDHAALDLKNAVRAHLEARGFAVTDVGTYTSDSCHYPEIAHRLCGKITDGTCELGILICGTGIGMSMAANKHTGIRAACCSDTYSAKLTREHNDANVLCFGARVVGEGLALDLVDIFLDTKFSEGPRHKQRIDLLAAIENGTIDAQ